MKAKAFVNIRDSENILKAPEKGLKVHNSKLKAATINYNMAAPIRAAYYVAWDAQSYFSLRRSINKLNMIIPEWFLFIPTESFSWI